MGKRLEADDPSDIIQGKRKRTISSRVKSVAAAAKNVPKKVKDAVKKKSQSSKKNTKSVLTSDSSSDDSSDSSINSSRPTKCIHPTVQSDEEDEARLIAQGIDQVINIDVNGDAHSSRTLGSRATSPAPSGSENGEGLTEETDEQELGQSIYLCMKINMARFCLQFLYQSE